MTRGRWIAAVCIVVVGTGAAAWLIVGGGGDDETADRERSAPARPSTSIGAQAASVKTVLYKPMQRADVYRPSGDGPFPAALLVHGGGLSAGSRNDAGLVSLARFLQQRGVLSVSIDYTLNAGFAPANGDVRDALAWLKARPSVVPGRIALVGHSSGAGLVAATGYQDGARAVVLVAPGLSSVGTARTYGTADDPETLVIHGTLDELVSADEIRQVVDAIAATGIAYEYRPVERLGHYEAVRAQVEPISTWLAPRLLG